MPGVSEEELEQLRKDNEKLREQLDGSLAKQAENEAARLREYEAKQLQAENVRLQADVNRAKAASLVGASKDGTAQLMANADAELAAAQARLEAPVGPVDTNADNGDKKADKAQNGGN